MTEARLDDQSSEDEARVYIEFTEEGTFVVSATDDEEVEIPESAVQRCFVLLDILDQDDAFERELPMKESIADVKAWLRCAELCTEDDKAAALVNQDDDTLLGALKVSRPTPG